MDAHNNEIIRRPNWWKRNWKWALPTGGCLTLLILFITIVGLGAFGIVKNVKENTNYDTIIAKVQTHEAVTGVLGTPIEQDGIGSYNISINNGDRTSGATIPIKGPNGTGQLYVTTSGKGDSKTYTQLEVYIDKTEEVINLLPLEIEESSDTHQSL